MTARKTRAPRIQEESGSVLVLFSVFLGLFLVCAAIVIDVGYWWANAKKAQVAADACALAAAGDSGFPKAYNQAHCTFGSKEYVLTNVPPQSDPNKGAKHLSTTVVAPYKGDPKRVEATVRMRVRTFFGRIVGLDHVDLTRRAVAERQSGEGNMAIYSHDDSCSEGLEFNGENHNINGLVHSNGEYQINNGGLEPFWAADGTRVDCGASVNPHGSARFGGDGYCCTTATLPRELDEELSWPVWFTPGEFGWLSGCTYNGEEITVKSNEVEIKGPPGPDHKLNHSGTIPTGTYCASKVFKIDADDLAGTITALSPEIQSNGNSHNFQPHQKNVLFFTVPNNDTNSGNDGSMAAGGNPSCNPNPAKEMILNGNSHTWTGVLFNPCGRILVNVGGATVGSPALTGTIVGLQVKINGKNFVMVGKDNFGGTTALALFE